LLCRIVDKLCGKLSHNKSVHSKIVFSNKECILGFLDADGAFSFFDINELILKFNHRSDNPSLVGHRLPPGDFNAVWSSRIQLSGRKINRSPGRFLLGRILATVVRTTFSGLPWDTQSGFKLFNNSQLFRAAFQQEFKCRWLFDIELLLRIRANFKTDYSIWEEPVSEWKDISGSKVGFRGYRIIIKDFFILFYNYKMWGK
jgi:hypothetical protein